MNITQEMLEILIGKYLDGEITPSEQCILESELQKNSQAKKLLEQLQNLHERSCQVVASEITEQGESADKIFERAWRQQTKHPLCRIIRLSGHLRFAAGLAAGLIIGLALHLVLPGASLPHRYPAPINAFVKNTFDKEIAEEPDILRLRLDPTDNAIHNVDWYSFTDEQGNQWLIEGFRENIVRPAVYDEGL